MNINQITDWTACTAKALLLLLDSGKENIRVMWQKKKQLIATALMLLSMLTAGAGVAGAVGGNGLRISPVRKDLVINPGQSQTVYIGVTNVTGAPATLQAVVNDFIGNPDESGNPAIILDPNQFASSHSLKRYIGPINNFSLSPGQSKDVPVVITVPKNAAGGGYFGAVRFGPAGSNSGPNQTVSLAGSVGSLILVKVPGDIKEEVHISSFDVRRNDHPSSFFLTNKNLSVTTRFKNMGNVQEAPFGKILLKNRSGKILSTFEINNTQPPGNVLPDSIRKFPVPINKVGSLGQYKLEGNFGYGASGQLLSASTTFYVIPKWLILTFVAVVVLLVFLVFGVPRLVKAYNRRILRKAGRS
jgi:hypothetical protein